MNSIKLKFSIKFKKFLDICKNVLNKVEEISQKDHKKLIVLLEKYKLFYIYKYFFVYWHNKNLKLPQYKKKKHISLYKQKTIDIDGFSTLPFYHSQKEKAIYYVYADNSINWSLSIHNSIKNIKKEEENINNYSNNNLIRNLLLTPINDLNYQLMILDNLQEETKINNIISEYSQKNNKKSDKNNLNKILKLNNEEFLSLFEMHQLYQELINIKNKLQKIKHLKEIEIIFEDYLKDGFNFYNPNKKNFIYEVIVVWKYIIKKNSSHIDWIKLVDETNNLLWDNQKLRSLINKTQKEIKLLNDLITVSHNVS